jgi:hypothetical protein
MTSSRVHLATFMAWVALLAALPSSGTAQADAWWHHVTVLADDSMRGRETGSPEHRKAAEYVAAAFRQAGLTPAGTDGWFQPVRFIVRTLDEARSSVALVRDGVAQPLVLGEEGYLGLRAPMAARVDAPVVFAGYGLTIPEYGHDDLAGLDVRGKIVAFISAPPAGIPGPVVSHARSHQWDALREAGAVGTVTFFGVPRAGDIPWSRSVLNRLEPSMTLADSTLSLTRGQQIALTIRGDLADRLLAGSGHTIAELAVAADSGRPLPRFPLAVSIRAVMVTATHDVTSDNIAGLLPGSDPALKGEVVVVSAHVDHIGVGRPIDGDSINNGAMDNASGSATLIETARALAALRGAAAPRRSVLFLAVTGEEKGLLGSRYYAFHPTVAPSAIVADLNTDMFLPINPFRSAIVNGLEESNLADDARSVGQAMGIAILTDPEPDRNAFVRSDQYSFIQRGVPSISLKVGFERGTPEHDRVKAFRLHRYHAPSDDLLQPVDRQSAADFNRFYLALVRAVANRPTRPAWYATSYFRRFAAPGPTP